MKVIVFQHYGSPDFLELIEVAKPIPRDNEVLIKIHAASIDESDWAILQGIPFPNRFETGLFKPKMQPLGADVAGTIDTVGKDVKQFRIGEEVFGDLYKCGRGGIPRYLGGSFDEYVCTHENALTAKLANISFEQAASLPQAGALAWRWLRPTRSNNDSGTVDVNDRLQENGPPDIYTKQGSEFVISGHR